MQGVGSQCSKTPRRCISNYINIFFRNICKCLGTKFIKNQEGNILIDAVESKLTGIKEIKSYVKDNVFCCPEQGATMFDSLS